MTLMIKKIYRPKDLAQFLNVTPRTIINYEKEGKIEKAQRDKNNWRYYTYEQMKRILIQFEKWEEEAAIKETRVITIANLKGGTAKTTTAVNLAAGLAMIGNKALLIDFDPQGNATECLGFDPLSFEKTIKDIIDDYVTLFPEVIIDTDIDNLSLVPANLNFAIAEVILPSRHGADLVLRQRIKPLLGVYDFIVIDCSPHLGKLTVNAIVAATEIIIPVEMSYLSVRGIQLMMNTITSISAALELRLRKISILPTKFDIRNAKDNQMLELLRNTYKDSVMETIIHQNVSLSDSQSEGKVIYHSVPNSKGAKDYSKLVEEVMKNDKR